MIDLNFSLKTSLCIISALLSLLIFTPKANAALYLYTIPSTNFTTGVAASPTGTLSGSFVWDQVSTLTSVNLITTAGTAGSGGNPFVTTNYTSATVSGTAITFVSGTATLSIGFNKFVTPQTLLDASERQPANNKGNPRGLTFVFPISGTLVAVPEPSTYAILAGGLALGVLAAAKGRRETVLR